MARGAIERPRRDRGSLKEGKSEGEGERKRRQLMKPEPATTSTETETSTDDAAATFKMLFYFISSPSLLLAPYSSGLKLLFVLRYFLRFLIKLWVSYRF